MANAECFVCVVQACGEEGSTKPIIYGTDNIFYSVNKLMSKVSQNDYLLGKPKLFFVLINECYQRKSLASGIGDDHRDDHTKIQYPKTFLSTGYEDTFLYYHCVKKGKFYFDIHLEFTSTSHHLHVDFTLISR